MQLIIETKPAAPRAVGDGTDTPKATVLVVEDEPAVRNLATRLLELHGYNVLAAASSRDALLLWEQHQDEIDLLLADVTLPDGISGCELAHQCVAQKPLLKVIYTSGFYEVMSNEGHSPEPGCFIPKPYRPQELLRLIAEIMGEGNAATAA